MVVVMVIVMVRGRCMVHDESKKIKNKKTKQRKNNVHNKSPNHTTIVSC